MKRFLVFAGDDCYPCGGMNDFYSDFDTLEECTSLIESKRKSNDWWHVYDTVLRKEVLRKEYKDK